MRKIERDLQKSSLQSYDLIIVGGGIYGIMLTYEAVRRNLRPLLLEKNDFISSTSLNHLRTVHGGLRYLQTMDIRRFRESVQERKWFLKYLSQYVNVMPCLLPLYGKGLYRKPIFKVALLLNDLLSFNRNFSIRNKQQHLPHGRIIGSQKTREIFPRVDDRGLTGSALWYDANIEEFQRLIMELIKILITNGASLLNYTHAHSIMKKDNEVVGVKASDMCNSSEYTFKAPVVINAAGPWCREVAKAFDKDHFSLFKKRLLVWNILFDQKALSNYALGLTPNRNVGQNYFFHPWKDRLLVGTGEVVIDSNNDGLKVPDENLERFIADINCAVPGIDLSLKNIQRIYPGILPAEEDGSMTKREKIISHSNHGGPKGLYSVSGIKFTTSRLVSEKVLNQVFPKIEKKSHETMLKEMKGKTIKFSYQWEPKTEEDLKLLGQMVTDESVLHLSDLILRRTSLGDNPNRVLRILPQLKSLFNWTEEKWNKEVAQLTDQLNIYPSSS